MIYTAGLIIFLFSQLCNIQNKHLQDTLYRVYTYSRDLENGLCDRHKKAEIVRLNDFQKQETGSIESSYKGRCLCLGLVC